jgi:hypothetical protein
MKKIVISIIAVVSIIACNKVPSSNIVTAPWAGKGSLSALINKTPFLPDTATYAEINVTNFVYGSIVAKPISDTNWVDSTKTVKNLTIFTPTGGGAVNASYNADSTNKNYIVTYQEVTSDIGTSLPIGPTTSKSFTTLASKLKLTIQNYENDAAHIKGYFYGSLRSVNTVDYDTIRTFENGFYNVKK